MSKKETDFGHRAKRSVLQEERERGTLEAWLSLPPLRTLGIGAHARCTSYRGGCGANKRPMPCERERRSSILAEHHRKCAFITLRRETCHAKADVLGAGLFRPRPMVAVWREVGVEAGATHRWSDDCSCSVVRGTVDPFDSRTPGRRSLHCMADKPQANQGDPALSIFVCRQAPCSKASVVTSLLNVIDGCQLLSRSDSPGTGGVDSGSGRCLDRSQLKQLRVAKQGAGMSLVFAVLLRAPIQGPC
jgi:hypothetical protein